MPSRPASLFVDKAIERLDRLDREQVESLLRGLRREREFLEGVFNRLTEGVLVLNADWQVVWTNEAARRLTGLDRARRVTGERLFELPLDDDLRVLLRRLSLEGQDARNREIAVRKPDEAILSVSLLSGIGQASDATTHVLIVEDRTEQRAEQARRQEAEKIASLATLTAGVAHEIKNPLNSLKIHAQLLRRMVREPNPSDVTRERIERSTDVLLEEIARLSGVVEEFLTAARPTRPELRARRLAPLLERLADIVRPELDDKRIELVLDLDPDSIELRMDEGQILQALLNLARNAVEAIEARRAADPETEGRIEITTRGDKKRVHIRIADTGCGIAEEDLKRIAEPYFTTKLKGAGLGLMVVSRVVREHGGHLHVESLPDRGASVTLTLPRRRVLPRSLTEDAGRDREPPARAGANGV